jgi:3-dehydroquinate synthase
MLAMMDAAVGGKTAVDLPYGKNLVGAFHQPRLVLADVAVLKSLPERETNSGWAEAIKHGLIMDAGLFQDFERRGEAVRSLDPPTTIDIVKRSVAVKADVVTRDEKEKLGLRVLLNYGHTVGHAIEAATGYTRYLHGEAVSIGMTAAARIGLEVGLMSEDETERQRQVLEDFQLPVSLDGADGVDPAALKEAMTLDKKTVGGAIRWVLLYGIGRAVTRGDVPESVVDAALESLGGRS